MRCSVCQCPYIHVCMCVNCNQQQQQNRITKKKRKKKEVKMSLQYMSSEMHTHIVYIIHICAVGQTNSWTIIRSCRRACALSKTNHCYSQTIYPFVPLLCIHRTAVLLPGCHAIFISFRSVATIALRGGVTAIFISSEYTMLQWKIVFFCDTICLAGTLAGCVACLWHMCVYVFMYSRYNVDGCVTMLRCVACDL